MSWEEHLRNDRFFLRQVGRKTLTQSIDLIEYMVLWAHVIRPQTASRSVQPFLQGSWVMNQRDQQTDIDHATRL